jgi:hypothetical protein
MNQNRPQNSKVRPNWYKMRLPPHLTKWATECLQEEVDFKRYQPFQKVSVSCKNNGKTHFLRLLFEGRVYKGGKDHGSEIDLKGLPVSYLIEVNKGILKGNKMEYDIGDDVKYHEVYPVYSQTVELNEESRFTQEKYRLFKFIEKFTIPRVKKSTKQKN